MDAVRDHRPEVVRRLLARGLSRSAIEQLLPGWSALAPTGHGDDEDDDADVD